MRRLITFDWAIKRLLRSKANFDILEGFLSELLKEDIQIVEVLESESNKKGVADKFNRVDLKIKNSRQQIILIKSLYWVAKMTATQPMELREIAVELPAMEDAHHFDYIAL
jgi:hypothetical protein